MSAGTVVATSPDQRLIAVSSPTGTVSFEDARTGEAVGSPTAVDPASFGYVYAFTPDDTALAIVLPDGGVRIINISPTPRSLGHRNPVTIAAGDPFTELSPDGKLIAIGRETGDLAILDAGTGLVVRELAAVVTDGRFSPRGDVFAFYGWDDTLNLLDIRGGSVRQLPTNGEPAASVGQTCCSVPTDKPWPPSRATTTTRR